MSKHLPHGLQVRWLGHSTFDITSPAGEKFLFDPFISDNPAFPKSEADAVRAPAAYQTLIISHPHFDHFADAVPLLKGDRDLKVITQFEIGEWLKGQHIKEDQIIGMNTGGSVQFRGVRITMIQAVHTSSLAEHGGPRAIGAPVGYVLRFPDNYTIYYTGDTAVTMDMQIVRDLYKPDLVILPIGDFYTMGAEQAAYALKLLQPKLAFGVHWGTWNGMPPGTPDDLEKELAQYKLPTQLIKLKPGETLS